MSLFSFTSRSPRTAARRYSNDSSGTAFFPEAAQEVPPEVAKGIIITFIGNLGQDEVVGGPPAFAARKSVTECRDLVAAFGGGLMGLGARDGLCTMQVSKRSTICITQEEADNGSPEAMIDYGLKLQLCRASSVKATALPTFPRRP